MTRRTYCYDADLDAMVQIRGPGSNHYEERSGLQIVRDIEGYRAMGSDVACDGKRPWISGRRQHREYLKRNGYIEVGNEKPVVPGYEPPSRMDRINDIRRAMGHFGSNVRD